MINRRKFILQSGALTVGSMAINWPAPAASVKTGNVAIRPLGLQLYTLMNEIDADLDGTLKRVADIGYTELESAYTRKGGFYGLDAKAFAAKAKSFGLQWKAHHIVGAPFKMPSWAKPPVGADGKPMVFPPMKNLKENYQEVVDAVAEAGVSYLVCSSTPIETAEEIKQSIAVFQKTGEACKKAGIQFAFHNHWKEFERVEGNLPYDLFLTEIPADLMKFELDLAWATRSGTDPVELFKKHPGRFPLWHVKDISPITQSPVEVGEGYVQFKRIIEAADIAGLQHMFVEQDAAPKPFDNITTSFHNLSAMLSKA